LQERRDTIQLIIDSLRPWTEPQQYVHHSAFGDAEIDFLKQTNMLDRYRENLLVVQNQFNVLMRSALKEIAQRMSAAGQCLSIGF